MKIPQTMDIVREEEFDDEIDLREYLYVLYKYKWAILGFSLVITILTTLYVYTITPIFQATATLLIESEDANVVSIDEVYGIPTANNEYYETQFQILQSRELAERVIDTLKLAEHPEFDPAQKKDKFSFNPLNWIPKSWLPKQEPTELALPFDHIKRN